MTIFGGSKNVTVKKINKEINKQENRQTDKESES